MQTAVDQNGITGYSPSVAIRDGEIEVAYNGGDNASLHVAGRATSCE